MDLTDEQQKAIDAWLDDVVHFTEIRNQGGDDAYTEDECSEAIDEAFEEIVSILLAAREARA